MNIQGLRERFASIHAHSPAGAIRAPGRVNLIGEHTDYNDGFVLPIAISRQVVAVYAPRNDRLVRLASLQAGGDCVEVKLDGPITPSKEDRWANYCRGVIAGLVEHGVALSGADILFDSDVPLGGGLSSSAALEVATALAMLEASGARGAVAGGELAKLCQKAEHQFAGAPCGIMDQSIVSMGQGGRAMLLDCRSGEIRQVRFDDPSVVLLVADTRVKHAISDGGYARRRDECFAAAKKLGAPALRDVAEQAVAEAGKGGMLAGKELMRARHVVGEIARTTAAAEALEVGDYGLFGRLMYASHASLRDDYEVSCEELDAIIEGARVCEGVFGARMTGGGFGGCAIVLARAEQAERITAEIQRDFTARFGRPCPVFATSAVTGAGVLE